MIRNQHLRTVAETALGPVRCHADSVLAALLLQAKTDKEMARDMGTNLKSVQNRIWLLKRRVNARNRVALALALRDICDNHTTS